MIDSDYKTFWASVKKHSRYNNNIPSTIDDANNATDIAIYLQIDTLTYINRCHTMYLKCSV